MPHAGHTLILETASRHGEAALARGDELLEVVTVPRQRRHGVELMPAVAALCDRHGVTPAALAAVVVSLGPGSFTGLRIAVATAKMLAMAVPAAGTRVVGVPTIDALRLTHPGAMVCLNVKRDTAWSAGPPGSGIEPALRPLDDIRATGLPLVGEAMGGVGPPRFSAEAVWRVARPRLATGDADDPAALAPLYVREPEAVTLWRERGT